MLSKSEDVRATEPEPGLWEQVGDTRVWRARIPCQGWLTVLTSDALEFVPDPKRLWCLDCSTAAPAEDCPDD